MAIIPPDINISFVLLLLGCFVLSRVPYIGRYIKVINTLIHETGHALMTLLTDGQVLQISLFRDTSGTTITKSKGKPGQFLIAAAGYPFASATAYFLMFLSFNNYYNAVLIIVGSFAFINLLFFVRNTHGVMWIIALLLLLSGQFLWGTYTSTVYMAFAFSGIVFFESLWSSIVVMILSFRKATGSGDAYILKRLTLLPAWFWGSAFAAFAVFVSYKVWLLYKNFNFPEV